MYDNSGKVKCIHYIKRVEHLSGNTKRHIYKVKYFWKYLCSDYKLFCISWTEFLRIRTKILNVNFSIPKVQGLFRCCFNDWTKNDDVSDVDLIVKQD